MKLSLAGVAVAVVLLIALVVTDACRYGPTRSPAPIAAAFRRPGPSDCPL